MFNGVYICIVYCMSFVCRYYFGLLNSYWCFFGFRGCVVLCVDAVGFGFSGVLDLVAGGRTLGFGGFLGCDFRWLSCFSGRICADRG